VGGVPVVAGEDEAGSKADRDSVGKVVKGGSEDNGRDEAVAPGERDGALLCGLVPGDRRRLEGFFRDGEACGAVEPCGDVNNVVTPTLMRLEKLSRRPSLVDDLLDVVD